MDRNRFTRTELVEMFESGVERKMGERELFAMRAFEEPGKECLMKTLIEYLGYDIRYYGLAAQYYSGDLSGIEDGYDEDLLLLTGVSEPPKAVYAQYLREIDPAAREDEKITHAAVKDLKGSIRRTIGVVLP